MTRLIIRYGFLCLLLLVSSVVAAQLGLELRSGYNDDLCPGYDDSANTVILDVINSPPLNPAPDTEIEYYWLITHPDAEWVYQTGNSARAFKLVFAGEYTMRCQVLYVSLASGNAYASFWSAPLIVQTGTDCD